MNQPLRWGIIAAGNIAKKFATDMAATDSGDLIAIASRSQDSADVFAKEFNVERAYDGYQKLLDDPDIDAVYISTPHPMHVEWCIKAARAGKHILCEKPIGMSRIEAEAAIEAARDHDVFLMEAFMYRCHPQTQKVVELIRDGAIGEVRMMRGSFGYDASDWKADSRVFADELGGGGILDVGCYPVSMSRLVAGAAMGLPFADPLQVTGAGHVGPTGVDHWAVATLRFDGDVVSQVSTAVVVGLDRGFHVYGSKGHLHVKEPWFCGGEVEVNDELITVDADKPLYAIEADTVAANIANRQAPSPAMSWGDTLGNMAVLDQWRAAMGQRFACEKAQNRVRPMHGGELKKCDDARMPLKRIAGVDKDISQLLLGCDAAQDLADLPYLLDRFFELGGTAMDTAHLYGRGESERTLGGWIASRNVREQVVIVTKGAHTPDDHPAAIAPQLAESLDRLQTDYVEIYLLHRDNPDVPVDEWATALAEQHAAGRIGAFGGSNWSADRIDAFNEYAGDHDLPHMTLMSNNFSLARMVNPTWEGCLSCSDPKTCQWLIDTQTPNIAWSSQARGFFSPGRAAPDKLDDELMVHTWYSDDNFERLDRAAHLAKETGVDAINIALAYVLQQPFPQFAVIGPRNLTELRGVMAALDVELSDEEMAWLNLEQ